MKESNDSNELLEIVLDHPSLTDLERQILTILYEGGDIKDVAEETGRSYDEPSLLGKITGARNKVEGLTKQLLAKKGCVINYSKLVTGTEEDLTVKPYYEAKRLLDLSNERYGDQT